VTAPARGALGEDRELMARVADELHRIECDGPAAALQEGGTRRWS